MAVSIKPKSVASASALDPLDRAVIAYLTLPLVIFLFGWFEVWAALPLIACVAYALRPVAALADGRGLPITRLQLTVAIAVGCAWSVCGGTGHVLFANPDWHLRDAVLHDLVAGRWPVGYGTLDGAETMLRAPVAAAAAASALLTQKTPRSGSRPLPGLPPWLLFNKAAESATR